MKDKNKKRRMVYMKTMIEKFHESEYGKNPANCVSFYLGLLCSMINDNNHQEYVDRIIRRGLIDFHNLNDLKKLNIEVERLLLGDEGKSKIYREAVSHYFVNIKKGDFGDGSEQMFCFGIGFSTGNSLDSVLTFSEAQ